MRERGEKVEEVEEFCLCVTVMEAEINCPEPRTEIDTISDCWN